MFHEGHGQANHPEERQDAAGRLGEELLSGQSERQKEIAEQIYEQLRAGRPIDELKPLIADLSRTATQDADRRAGDQRRWGRR
jgi:hypothetical protein